MSRSTIRPWVVGQEAVAVVGIEGVIDSKTEDTVTIAGVTLPRRLGNGVRYLSMDWPAGDKTTCDRDHCGPGCEPTSEEEELDDRVNDLERAIRDDHEDNHGGPFQFCRHRTCEEVNR